MRMLAQALLLAAVMLAGPAALVWAQGEIRLAPYTSETQGFTAMVAARRE